MSLRALIVMLAVLAPSLALAQSPPRVPFYQDGSGPAVSALGGFFLRLDGTNTMTGKGLGYANSTAAVPAWQVESGEGMYDGGTNCLGLAANALAQVIVCPDQVEIPAGTGALPGLTFKADGNKRNGMSWNSADAWGLSHAGAYKIFLQNGQVSLNADGAGSYATAIYGSVSATPELLLYCANDICTFNFGGVNADLKVKSNFNDNAIDVGSETTAAAEGVGIGAAHTAGNVDIGWHLASTGTAPTVATGTCASKLISASSTDVAGDVSAQCDAGETIIVTFADGYNSAPHCTFAPIDADAVTAGFYISGAATGTITFTAITGSVASADLNYMCVETQ